MNPLEDARTHLAQKIYETTLRELGEKPAVETKREFEKQFEACECTNPMQAMFCEFGHLTECHFPRDCEEANCSHYQREEVEEE